MFGLALGVSSMSLITNLIDIPSWAPVLGSMVGLGVGIDYALFIVTRHRELPRSRPAGRGVGRLGARHRRQAVVFAGGTVVVAILGLAVAGVPFMTAGGIAISVVVLVMVVASVTLLPAFLGPGRAPHQPARRTVPAAAASTAPVSPGWSRWVGHVTRQPVALRRRRHRAAARPRRAGAGAACRHPRRRRAARRAGPSAGPTTWWPRGSVPGSNGPLVIAVDIAGDPAVVDPLLDGGRGRPGHRLGGAPEMHAGAGVATSSPSRRPGRRTRRRTTTIERLRADVLPSVLAGSPAQAHVGGQTANFADVGARVNDRLPLFIAAVLALSFLLLMLVFRSVLVPLKAAVLNLLSIGAAYGVMVMVFQWGWGAGLIGLESTVPIVSFIPMFMFAILFGLSMDYEVFLLSRVREEYLATGDNRHVDRRRHRRAPAGSSRRPRSS